MEKTFSLFHTPGHGYLKVPKTMLTELGITKQITCGSYTLDEWTYLEEDADLGTFIKALEARGITVKLRDCFDDENRTGRGLGI